ncbi:unnamed protein product [Nezara viridula]|uniref:C2H2-type domain-containing protein n=1 Tax=Nezara viridula TaxID=85310 RepID=A0A9P0HFR5_NEZVI|nr:unnamed protein product [Nezara viridula]
MAELNLEIRAILLHYFKSGYKATNAVREINKMMGEKSVSERAGQVWFKKFRDGDMSLESKSRSGRPRSLDSAVVLAAAEVNPSTSSRKLSAALGVSHTTINNILRAGCMVPGSWNTDASNVEEDIYEQSVITDEEEIILNNSMEAEVLLDVDETKDLKYTSNEEDDISEKSVIADEDEIVSNQPKIEADIVMEVDETKDIQCADYEEEDVYQHGVMTDDDGLKKNYQCPYCDHKTGFPTNLKNHIMAIHTKEKPHKCPHCDYSSVRPGNLKAHVMSFHTKEKPLQCSFCSYRAVIANTLKKHIASVHSSKTHQCPHLPIGQVI